MADKKVEFATGPPMASVPAPGTYTRSMSDFRHGVCQQTPCDARNAHAVIEKRHQLAIACS